MTKKTTAKERNDAVAGYSSFSDLSDNGQGTSKPLFHNSISDTAKLLNSVENCNYIYFSPKKKRARALRGPKFRIRRPSS